MGRSDGDWVRRCLNGHADAFRHLVSEYEGPLAGFLAGRLRGPEEVMEAAQETFVRAYFALSKLRKPDSFFAWLLGIAQRVAKESRRSERREHEAAAARAEEAPPWESPAEEPDPEIARAVAGLPEPYREVVLLRFYGGLTCVEVSRRLDVPLGTVTKRLSRAYEILRESLRPRDAECDCEAQP